MIIVQWTLGVINRPLCSVGALVYVDTRHSIAHKVTEENH